MKISVIMPAYNEAPTIKQSISRLLKQKFVAELIVINDGSTDATAKILTSLKHPRLKIINQPQNLGKGAAVRTGISQVTSDYFIVQDADLEYDPEDIINLIKPIQQKKAEVVFGSRFTGPHRNLLFWNMVANKILNFLVNLLYNTTLSDMETCYKLVPTKLARSLNLAANDFTIEPEITCKILKRGVFIYEVPISYTGRSYADGKKISWIDGFQALKTVLLIKLGIY
jgi:glycosyltransferase involved in cell wall biosynthesis